MTAVTGAAHPGDRPARRSPGAASVMDPTSLVLDGYVADLPTHGDSPASQRHRLLRAAASRNWRLGRIFTPPWLELAILRVESGESDGLLVAHIACLGTSLEEVLAVVERLQAAGGRFLSVADGIDLDAESGRLAVRLLLSLTLR